MAGHSKLEIRWLLNASFHIREDLRLIGRGLLITLIIVFYLIYTFLCMKYASSIVLYHVLILRICALRLISTMPSRLLPISQRVFYPSYCQVKGGAFDAAEAENFRYDWLFCMFADVRTRPIHSFSSRGIVLIFVVDFKVGDRVWCCNRSSRWGTDLYERGEKRRGNEKREEIIGEERRGERKWEERRGEGKW